MANFLTSVEKLVEQREGGWRVINVTSDRGGQTYAGISRRANPSWKGWTLIDGGIDSQNESLKSLARDLYEEKYWNSIRGGEITNQGVADVLFSCGVLSGHKTMLKLVQTILKLE